VSNISTFILNRNIYYFSMLVSIICFIYHLIYMKSYFNVPDHINSENRHLGIKKNIRKNKYEPKAKKKHRIARLKFLNNKRNNSGTLTFEYKGLDQLDRLINIIKDNY